MRPTLTTRLRRLALRRFVLCMSIWVFAPLLLILLLRLVWGWQADQRLRTLREKLHTQGIRVYPSDFPDAADIPREQNAALDLLDAWNLSPPLTEPQWTLLEDRVRRRSFAPAVLTPAEIAEYQRIFVAYKPALDAFDAAAARPRNVWPRASLVEPTTAFSMSYPGRSLASAGIRMYALLNKMAIIAYHNNDDAEALVHIRRNLLMTRILLESPKDYVHYCGLSYRDSTLELLESMLPAMDFEDPAVAEQACVILRLMIDDPTSHESPIYAHEGLITGAFEFALDGNQKKEWWILAPLATANITRTAELYAAEMPLYSASNFQEAKALPMPPSSSAPTMAEMLTNEFVEMHVLPNEYFISQYWTSVARRRSMALLLAARLYAAHEGHLPQNATDLVPIYLPAVPLDPFARNDQPLHYRNDPAGPTAWSVGENGADETSPKSYSTGDDVLYGAASKLRSLPLPR